MRIPESASTACEQRELPDDKFLPNPFPGLEFLTKQQALETISKLASMLMIDFRYRGRRE